MEGTRPARRHHCAQPRFRLHACAVQRVEPFFLRRAAGEELPSLSGAAAALHGAGFHLHRHRGLPLLPDAATGNALARLDDTPLPAALAGQPGLLPPGTHALCRTDGRPVARQPGPAHPGRPQALHLQHRRLEHGPAQCAGHTVQLRRHPVVAQRRLQLLVRRHRIRHPRLHALGRHSLLHRRQRHHPLRRAPADPAELPAAAA